MRILVTLSALALSTSGWSAQLEACSNADAGAALTKFRQHVIPVPDTQPHRWLVSNGGEGWTITEYSELLVFIRCKPASKADVLNGVQYGEIEFQYDASRTAGFPKVTSAGLETVEWSEWTDHAKPMTQAEEAKAGLLMSALNDLALSSDSRDRRIPFRKYKGKIQLEWEYDKDSVHPKLMTAADVGRFFSTADAEAAKLRMAEAEQARLAQEAQQAQQAEKARQVRQSGMSARITRPADPYAYYPAGSIRREEQGSPVVKICVGPSGKLLREPVITDTSGFPELDAAAVEVAKDSRYSAGTENGAALPESCLKFKVKFITQSN